jgi:hypothetical protein
MRERDYVKNTRNKIFTNLHVTRAACIRQQRRRFGLATVSASAAARFFCVITLAYTGSAEGRHHSILCEEDLTLERYILFIEIDLEYLNFV